jgi:hypothetical protein
MNTEYHEDTIYNEVDHARSMLRELADCDALWRKLTPTVAEEARVSGVLQAPPDGRLV